MILFGIVCFRENFTKSITYIDLISSFQNSTDIEKELNIVVFDNTDSKDWNLQEKEFKSQKINLYYFHDPANPGISVAYNKIFQIAKDNNFSHIVFLDQDTHLQFNVFDIYQKAAKSINFGAPRIFVNNEMISPSGYRLFRTQKLTQFNKKKITSHNHTVINSGILVRTDIFEIVGGYNKMLKLDFCDHDFIRRVTKYEKYIEIIPVNFVQNFSTNTNNLSSAIFRYSIFVKDLLVFRESQQKSFLITIFVDIPHLMRLSYQYRTFKFVLLRFKHFLS